MKTYSPLHDCELTALVDHTTYNFVDSRNWLADWHLVPDFEDWLECFKDHETNWSNSTFYDLDAQKYGQLQLGRTTFDLKNGGMIRLTELVAMRQASATVRVDYANLSAGILSSSGWEKAPILERRETIQRDLTPEEMEIYNPILKDKKKKLKKEEEDKLIRTVSEEKVYEDITYMPPEHALLSAVLGDDLRVVYEHERVVDLQKLSANGIKLTKPLEQLFGAQAVSYSHAPVTTVALLNGVIVKVMANGDILIKTFDRQWGEEEARLITNKGTVISFLKNDRKHVMMSNGNTLTYDGKQMWNTTNNKGLRREIDVTTGIEKEISAIPSATKVWSALSSYPITYYREDGVHMTVHREGDRVSSFADGTQILRNGAKTLCIVENPGLPTVRIYNGDYKPHVYRKGQSLVNFINSQAAGEVYEIDLGIGKVIVYVSKEGFLRTLVESNAGDLIETTSEGYATLFPGECRWGATQILKNKQLLAQKRDTIAKYYEEIERTTSEMMEAMSNMSKFHGKGSKKLNKKQLREEREREEKKIQDYRDSMHKKLLEELVQIDKNAETTQLLINEFFEFYGQFDKPIDQRRSGIITFNIHSRSLTTTDVEGREVTISDDGHYSVVDPINVAFHHLVRQRQV